MLIDYKLSKEYYDRKMIRVSEYIEIKTRKKIKNLNMIMIFY